MGVWNTPYIDMGIYSKDCADRISRDILTMEGILCFNGAMDYKLTDKQENRYYVYHLIDPRDGSIFYVGKGCGCRINHHVKNARAGRVDNAAKHKRIALIMADGLRVIERKVSVGLSELNALQIEEKMIREMKESLTNISKGMRVAPGGAIRLQAEIMLKNMPSFELWVGMARKGMLEVYRKVYGSERAVYDLICGVLREVVNG